MDTPPASIISVSGRTRAQGAVSTLPRTAVTGATCASSSRISEAPISPAWRMRNRSEEHTSELQSRQYLVCRLLLEKKKILYLCRDRLADDWYLARICT